MMLAKTLRALTVVGALAAGSGSIAAEVPQQPASAPVHAIPFKQTAPEEDSLVYRALGGFLIAILAAGGIAYGIKRYAPWIRGNVRTGKTLSNVETLRLTTKSTLFVVQFRDEELLLAEGEHGVQLLRVRPVDVPAPVQGTDHA